MPIGNSPRYERIFIQQQSSLATIPNSAGTWTNTGAKLLRSGVNGISLMANIPLTPVPWKTGTRSTQPGITGRKSGSWSLSNLPIIPSGTAGTVPDADVLWQAIFGQAATVVGGTSATYSFLDSGFLPFALFKFQHGQTTLTQKLAYGCTVEQWSVTLNGNVFEMSASGGAVYCLDSDYFASEDTTGKAGLTSYPLEVSSPTSVGAIMNGFTGTATFDGNGMDITSAALIDCSLSCNTGTMLVGDAFGSGYPVQQLGGERQVSLSFGFSDSDATALVNLKNKAKAKTPINITLVVGNVAGSIVTMTIKAVQMQIPDMTDDGARVKTSFGSSAAHASAIGSVDDLTIAFT